VIELSDGCLCCTVRGELVDTLADLIDRMQTGRIPPLKRIVVETTGLADPVPVLQSILGHPALAAALRLSGVIATIDTLNGADALDRHEEAVRQIAVADRIVLTKSDIEPVSADLLARLRTLNPRADIVPAADAAIRNLVEAGLRDPETGRARLAEWLGEQGHEHHHHDHHDHDHDGHHHHHDDRIASFSLVHDRPLAFSTIEMFLDLLRSTHGDKLLRMKGVVELAEDPQHPLVIHGVGRFIHPPARLPSWPSGPRGARLVLIGMDLDRDHVERLFAAFVGRPSIDTPDRTALEANPLAVPGYPAR
jgi:G3E family GTPase